MVFLSILFVLLVLIPFFLSPVRCGDTPIRTFLRDAAVCFSGICLPIVVFLLHGGLTPDSKARARAGWLDCFQEGSICLFPLVVFASWGFHRVLVLKRRDVGTCTVSSIFIGAIVSWGCFIFWWIRMSQGGRPEMVIMILVPIYVGIWYSVLAYQLWDRTRPWIKESIFSVLITVPFWIASIRRAKDVYAALPETSGDCFVVTAANGGHETFVGPFFEAERKGVLRSANLQLIRLWKFEESWKRTLPSSHKVFRAVYNRIGPVLAARIRCKVLADIAFLLLKPVELGSVLWLRLLGAISLCVGRKR